MPRSAARRTGAGSLCTSHPRTCRRAGAARGRRFRWRAAAGGRGTPVPAGRGRGRARGAPVGMNHARRPVEGGRDRGGPVAAAAPLDEQAHHRVDRRGAAAQLRRQVLGQRQPRAAHAERARALARRGGVPPAPVDEPGEDIDVRRAQGLQHVGRIGAPAGGGLRVGVAWGPRGGGWVDVAGRRLGWACGCGAARCVQVDELAPCDAGHPAQRQRRAALRPLHAPRQRPGG